MKEPAPRPDENSAPGWTFLSNHAHVLVCLATDPGARVRDVADRVGITERAVQSILGDLEAASVLERVREGRRNRYVLHLDAHLRHPLESHRTIGDLVAMVSRGVRRRTATDRRSGA